MLDTWLLGFGGIPMMTRRVSAFFLLRCALAICILAGPTVLSEGANGQGLHQNAQGPNVPDLLWRIRSMVVRLETPSMTGTGFVIDERGYIVTNAHVVRKDDGTAYSKVLVTFRYGPKGEAFEDRVEGEVLGADDLSDLAVVWVDPDKLAPDLTGLSFLNQGGRRLSALRWAKSYDTGEDVLAIGFAWGQAGPPTVSKGVISAPSRFFPPAPVIRNKRIIMEAGLFAGLIQTDAAVNPGNSGGPLVNRRGEVVGVNTYGYDTLHLRDEETRRVPVTDENGKQVTIKDDTGKVIRLYTDVPYRRRISEGIHYARALYSADRVVQELINHRCVRRAPLGLQVATVTRAETNLMPTPPLGFNLMPAPALGVKIAGFEKDSPARAAGLQVGDVIVRMSAEHSNLLPPSPLYGHLPPPSVPIQSVGDLNNALIGYQPGARVTLYYRRPSAESSEKLELMKKRGSMSPYDFFVKWQALDIRHVEFTAK
jgi:S1-C subfamily serine protease